MSRPRIAVRRLMTYVAIVALGIALVQRVMEGERNRAWYASLAAHAAREERLLRDWALNEKAQGLPWRRKAEKAWVQGGKWIEPEWIQKSCWSYDHDKVVFNSLDALIEAERIGRQNVPLSRIFDPFSPESTIREAENLGRMRAKYELASLLPWLPFLPAPPQHQMLEEVR